MLVVGEGVGVVCTGCCAVFAETEGVGLTSRFSRLGHKHCISIYCLKVSVGWVGGGDGTWS